MPLKKLLGLCAYKSEAHELVSGNSPLSLCIHFEGVELPFNDLLILVEVHQVVIQEMNNKALQART